MQRLPLLLLALLFAATGAFAQTGKIVFIDLEKTFDSYEKTRSADQVLKSKAQEFEREKASYLERYKALEGAYQAKREESRNPIFSRDKQDSAAAEGERILLEKRELEGTMRQFEKDRKRQLEETMRRTRKRLVEDIQQVVREYALSKGIAAVLDTSGPSMNGFPTVVFSDDTVDITNDVINMLNGRR